MKSRMFTLAVAVAAMLYAQPVAAQGAQPGWQQWGQQWLSGYFGQYMQQQQQQGGNPQTQSDMVRFLIDLAGGAIPSGVPGVPGVPGQPPGVPGVPGVPGQPPGGWGQDFVGNALTDVAEQYGQEDTYALFAPAIGEALGQFDPGSAEYRNLTGFINRVAPPPPPPSRCVIGGEQVILRPDGAVVSAMHGGLLGRQVPSTNPRCPRMLQSSTGAVYCVATNGYVWLVQPQSPQPQGQCQIAPAW